jgi:hypothetical protein
VKVLYPSREDFNVSVMVYDGLYCGFVQVNISNILVRNYEYPFQTPNEVAPKHDQAEFGVLPLAIVAPARLVRTPHRRPPIVVYACMTELPVSTVIVPLKILNPTHLRRYRVLIIIKNVF